MTMRDRASAGLDQAERQARQTAAELKQKARQDVRTAERRLREVDRETVRNTAKRIQTSAPDIDSEATAEGIGDRAYRAGQAPAIIDASLDPGPSGPRMQMFASTGGMVDESLIAGGRAPRQETDPIADEQAPIMATVDSPAEPLFFGADEDREDDGVLEFDDALGAGGWF